MLRVLGLCVVVVACQAQPAPSASAASALPSPSGNATLAQTASPTVTPSVTPTATVAATSTPPATHGSFGQPALSIAGQPETVFDWQTDRCADDELADLPARAIRAANGTIRLYLSSTTSYRLVGPNFDSLTPDCTPVLTSAFDRNPADFDYGEWLGSPYTIDGKTVYDIVHEEYHGDQAGSVWQASRDFGAQQPAGAWRYLDWNGSNYQPMTYDAAHQRWQGRQPLCQISAGWMHPDLGCQPVLQWTSPVDATVTISGRVYDKDPGGGNGVRASISKGSHELFSAVIHNGDAQGSTFDLQEPVNKGDEIRFSIDARGDNGYDTTGFDPGIDLGGPPCPSGNHDFCTQISLTSAVSTDGGATFQQASPPALVAVVPHQYNPDWTRALWQPSNIVKSPRDGYYYALVQYDAHAADGSVNVQGMCLMRTDNLAAPSSWRAWDGSGFGVQFRDPYTAAAPGADCTLVSPSVGALTYGLSYNTFADEFIAVGVRAAGFFYSTSADLINWSAARPLMAATQVFTPGGEPPFLTYPTLIDPTSSSPSFDVTGQAPYLYYTVMHGRSAQDGMDVMRVALSVSR